MFEGLVQSYSRKFIVQTLARLEHGRLTITSKGLGKDGEELTFGRESEYKDAAITILNPNAWTRICQAFDLGFSEAYIFQEVECDDLLSVFCLYLRNRVNLGFGSTLFNILPRLRHMLFLPTNTIPLSRSNVTFHYDTSNELFSEFLSPDMNYSNGIWSNDPNESLETAQVRSVHNIIQQAHISSTDHILDIGCGWGHLAMEAVRITGCRVTGITLASEQKALAEKRIKAAGLEGRITILLCDYRSAPRPEGGYDRIVSVEMVEHVGAKYMNEFFGTISRLLKPVGGVLVMQAITTNNLMHDNKPGITTFTDRYIFPGGYLCSTNVLLRAIHTGSKGSLEVDAMQSIGPSYIRTLMTWRENFLKNWKIIRDDYVARHPDATEFDIEAFRRVWIYYFTYCESGFRCRVLTNHVIRAVRTPEPPIASPIPKVEPILQPVFPTLN
ncbi:Mycolic acid cyclopropane synthetase-domain-containing protein [Lipomyces tetrasporus]|uniref:Mycolic acid cyclopropane synthetase-domain-containing protein n=1 Tax=Lipomyces tetrasporus TaxID=54092 RepID=A0AAD7QK40_9ASCO|nr:Mycolic acid cyclopropane synthetase-domain-containing protein [Lipomyces tetrasporus]KAJ8096665.1 Mycolic acid cyclopropane synthetase-domain-containing protein [Lipomyces tetrasporus]